ncbi:MAG TPA: VWA domain-containing protein [Anaerolineae bacterium]
MTHNIKRLFFAAVAISLLITACDGGQTINGTPIVDRPSNAIEITIVYAPEFAPFMPEVMNNFNRTFAEGRNPVTGQPLQSGERPVYITGKDASSGVVMQGIVNAVIAPNNANVERPTIWSPSVSHWLALANYQSGRELFNLSDSPPTALAPVVIAIWESRLQAIQRKHPGQPIGWEELLEVLNDPNGWASYGISGRTAVYYGHTDPYISSTALSTLIAEFYASARYNSNNPSLRRLTLDAVNNSQVQAGVRQIEQLIKHYSARTTEFKEYIAQGPEYLDFVALEENDLIYINQGKTQYQPPEKLVALYPKEGTFWHEHPFATPNADWVTPEQRAAAKVFTDYVRSKPVQETILANGFRPAVPDVPLGYPITPDLGVDPNQPATVLDVPDPAVVAAVQASWQYVKKQADVLLLIDVSGSMSGDKIDQAKQAALAFLDKLPVQNRVGLTTFSDVIDDRVPIDSFERNASDMRLAIQSLEANGDTALYDAIIRAVETLGQDEEGDRIRAIVLLSDGQDTASTRSLNEMVNAINTGRADKNPILIIPVAYGGDADINALNAIARSSSTKVQSGDPANISSVLEIISSYF